MWRSQCPRCSIRSLIQTPLDHARFKVTLMKEAKVGSVGMARQLVANHGITGLYLGLFSTIIRDSLGLACYFGTYDFLIRHFTNDGHVNLLGSLVSGAAAGVAFWMLPYPMDYIKTLIQGDSLTNPKYKGIWNVIQQNKHLGIGTFYTGFGVMTARSVVVNAVGFMAFELGKRAVY